MHFFVIQNHCLETAELYNFIRLGQLYLDRNKCQNCWRETSNSQLLYSIVKDSSADLGVDFKIVQSSKMS